MQPPLDPSPDAVPVALVGDFNPSVIAHTAIPKALELAGRAIGVPLAPRWMHTATLAAEGVDALRDVSAIWVVPASPYADMDAALAAIRFARESGRPFLGTCGGFQHALIEYARNVLAWFDADHAETNPHAPTPLIAPLSCGLVEKSGSIHFRPGTRLRALYAAESAEETYHCNYGVNPSCAPLLEQARDLRISATDAQGEIRAVELQSHPFFIATLFQPERSALSGLAHPLITAFAAAAVEPRGG